MCSTWVCDPARSFIARAGPQTCCPPKGLVHCRFVEVLHERRVPPARESRRAPTALSHPRHRRTFGKNMADPVELLEFLLDGARYGDAADVKEALAQGAGVNAQDEGGRTGVCAWRRGDVCLPARSKESATAWFVYVRRMKRVSKICSRACPPSERGPRHSRAAAAAVSPPRRTPRSTHAHPQPKQSAAHGERQRPRRHRPAAPRGGRGAFFLVLFVHLACI